MCQCNRTTTRDSIVTTANNKVAVHIHTTVDNAPETKTRRELREELAVLRSYPLTKDAERRVGEITAALDDWSPEARKAALEARKRGTPGGAGSEVGRTARAYSAEPEDRHQLLTEHRYANHAATLAIRKLESAGITKPTDKHIERALEHGFREAKASGKHGQEAILGAGIGGDLAAEEAVRKHFGLGSSEDTWSPEARAGALAYRRSVSKNLVTVPAAPSGWRRAKGRPAKPRALRKTGDDALDATLNSALTKDEKLAQLTKRLHGLGVPRAAARDKAAELLGEETPAEAERHLNKGNHSGA